MKKIFLFIMLVAFVFRVEVRADEGMWLPYSLDNQNLYEMQQLGCQLTAEQIFDLNQPSLKDAIVQFGGGCTGELISPNGLLLTNHHCGLSYVQKHATVEHDYLTEGFWAKDYSEELPAEGMSASFLIRMEDVTDEVLSVVSDTMSFTDRSKAIREKIAMTTYTARIITCSPIASFTGAFWKIMNTAAVNTAAKK